MMLVSDSRYGSGEGSYLVPRILCVNFFLSYASGSACNKQYVEDE